MLNNCFIKAGKSAAGFYVLKNLLMRILKLVYFGLLCFILSASVVACSDDNPVSGGTEVPPETDNNGDGDNNPDTDNTLESILLRTVLRLLHFQVHMAPVGLLQAEQVERCMW